MQEANHRYWDCMLERYSLRPLGMLLVLGNGKRMQSDGVLQVSGLLTTMH
jgi:hypothetical protein